MKRLLDICASLFGLTILSPLFAVVALVNRLTGNDVFFRQTRVGIGLKPIRIYKFATMVKDAHLIGGTITRKNDPRVTPIGRYLRKWKLNELPQLINVLKGDMSLVGPRPLAAAEAALYKPDAATSIYNNRPGLTGWGSLHFHHEEDIIPEDPERADAFYRDEIMPRKAELELWYAKHRSFWLDLQIIFRTLLTLRG